MIKVGIIPARYASTRLPGKPLADINGKPMIQWVYENTSKSNLDRVIVATDDERVFDKVKEFGGDVMMTSKDHLNGSSRLAEVAGKIEADIIVNIQGDEPLISGKVIDRVLEAFEDKNCKMSTLKTKINNREEIENPNCVKVITDLNNDAIYFSRLPLPYEREETDIDFYKHIGIYGYRKEFLLNYVTMKPTKLELSESLEQLRVIENGYKIKVLETNENLVGVDTIEDLEKVREILK
ncbi:3-deoxy-manno-octulosonate cytidylyltransferase [Fusobacteria bacterium ZRK30]|nr:3-deoxy-manno-octulosonate cytidylyltransferase [Fusobacteria bacterium ZRK30]